MNMIYHPDDLLNWALILMFAVVWLVVFLIIRHCPPMINEKKQDEI